MVFPDKCRGSVTQQSEIVSSSSSESPDIQSGDPTVEGGTVSSPPDAMLAKAASDFSILSTR
jgi:hypothetical protein